MIIWLNGPHGIGKTTTAGLLAERIDGARIFDPEYVGFILRPTLSEVRPVPDFRDWRPWRAMVARAATSIHAVLDGVLIMPQTVPEQDYWHEIRDEILTAGIDLVHVTLIAEVEEHQRRISNDTVESAEVATARTTKIAMFRRSLDWLQRESTVITTDALTPEQVADRVCRTAGLA